MIVVPLASCVRLRTLVISCLLYIIYERRCKTLYISKPLSLGLGELCSKCALLCYADIPGKKLYYAPTKAYYAHIMPMNNINI